MRKHNKRRPYQVLMDEQVSDSTLWDRDTHIEGCFAGYQQTQGFGAAVYFALEMLSGIAVPGAHLEMEGRTEDRSARNRGPNPRAEFPVPWFCIASLAAAWEVYKEKGPPLGEAFGLEGRQGKLPMFVQLERALDYRALARFVWETALEAKSRNEGKPITTAIGDAANKFSVSEETVRRAWRLHGRAERNRTEDMS